MFFTAIREPHIPGQIDTWVALLRRMIGEWVTGTLGLTSDEYEFDSRLYGYDAVLDTIDPATGPPREVGVMLQREDHVQQPRHRRDPTSKD